MSDNTSEFGSFLAGFLIGGLIGAATALLIAPQSGPETRTFIKTKGLEIRDRVTAEAQELRTRADEYAVELRNRAEELARERGWIGVDDLGEVDETPLPPESA